MILVLHALGHIAEIIIIIMSKSAYLEVFL